MDILIITTIIIASIIYLILGYVILREFWVNDYVKFDVSDSNILSIISMLLWPIIVFFTLIKRAGLNISNNI